jgi:hypothetical protein
MKNHGLEPEMFCLSTEVGQFQGELDEEADLLSRGWVQLKKIRKQWVLEI